MAADWLVFIIFFELCVTKLGLELRIQCAVLALLVELQIATAGGFFQGSLLFCNLIAGK